ncbi:MAG: MoaD/ThiS family protein [Deltaproteobacteria bacterium]|nr:MoaD/ThiS family protein [Deltaproteobacteria bacterium]
MRYGSGRSGTRTMTLANAPTVTELLAQLGIPRSHVGLLLVNDVRSADFGRPLRAGDEIKIFGLVAGG